MSEHSAGSDVVSMKTTAKATDGGFLLNGTKMWITNVSSYCSPQGSIVLTSSFSRVQTQIILSSTPRPSLKKAQKVSPPS